MGDGGKRNGSLYLVALLSACYGSVWSVCASACQLSKLARTESLLEGVDRLKQTHAWCHTYCT